jgi:NADP-dependent 3-hydroxy acid dehydrogenase YdfG
MTDQPRTAVVTGASSGIGASTARHLVDSGFSVVIGARRLDRLRSVAERIGAIAMQLDVTDQASVDRFCGQVPGCSLLVNNAGGAIGLEPIERADIGAWQAMYETNVIGTLRMTRALLPSIIASGDGHIIIVGSVAAYEAYPGGGGYNAAKFAERAVASVLRQELLGQPVRVTEVDPGLVETDFSLVRFRGDTDRAAQVYRDVTPLTADDVAECIVFAATRPSHVNIDSLAVLARDQAGARQIHRHPT